MARTGRPSKWTQELQDGLCEQLRKGVPVMIACDFLGINHNTYYDWVEKKPDFSEAVRKARAESQIRCVELLMKASVDKSVNFNPIAWYLERTNRNEFGRVDKVETTHKIVQPSDLLKELESPEGS